MTGKEVLLDKGGILFVGCYLVALLGLGVWGRLARKEKSLSDFYLGGRRVEIIVTGHTHFERLAYRDGVLQINSGSPTHPHLYSTRLGTVGLLDLGPGRLEARVVKLGETEGLRNPGVELSFSLEDRLVSQL